MAVEFTNTSQTMRESLWLYYQSDPIQRICERLTHFAGAAWPYDLPGGAGSREGDVAFFVESFGPAPKLERSLAVTWKHAHGTPLPSLAATVTASRFGPFVNLTIAASYVYGSDLASRLAHEAVGASCAAVSMQCLLQLFCAMFPPTARRAVS